MAEASASQGSIRRKDRSGDVGVLEEGVGRSFHKDSKIRNMCAK
jgi:hypothetical protein